MTPLTEEQQRILHALDRDIEADRLAARLLATQHHRDHIRGLRTICALAALFWAVTALILFLTLR